MIQTNPRRRAARRKPAAYLAQASILVLVFTSSAAACNIPVFRFALERWTPDPYRMVLFHKGPLRQADKDAATRLHEYLADASCAANCTFDVVDLTDRLESQMEKLWQSQRNTSLPWLVARYPKSAKTPVRNAYDGPLDSLKVKALLDSPARRELARRLLAGTSTVWLFLESGNKNKDDAKATWLEGHLKKLEKDLKLPEMTTAPRDELRVKDLKLKIEFSLLRLSRTDPDESLFVRMLLGSEADLDECREPIVFPVFGRGLLLYALLGKGINENTVTKAAQFVLGPCSCEVKEQNPGVDLLTDFDWDGGLTQRLAPTPELPPLTGLAPQDVSSSTKEVGALVANRPPSTTPLWQRLSLELGIFVLVVLAATAALLLWKRH
ncbi:MAG: hypothetical protein HY040_19470 [Planctomycetes bacterium]|nr:hypothetical protein [Planctomycetota bacterium]